MSFGQEKNENFITKPFVGHIPNLRTASVVTEFRTDV